MSPTPSPVPNKPAPQISTRGEEAQEQMRYELQLPDTRFLAGPRSRLADLGMLFRIAWDFLKSFRVLHFCGPCVTIFGSGEPDWFAPWNNRDRAVQQRVCPLHPCIDRCGMDSYLCLDAVTVKDVLAQIERLNLAS